MNCCNIHKIVGEDGNVKVVYTCNQLEYIFGECEFKASVLEDGGRCFYLEDTVFCSSVKAHVNVLSYMFGWVGSEMAKKFDEAFNGGHNEN